MRGGVRERMADALSLMTLVLIRKGAGMTCRIPSVASWSVVFYVTRLPYVHTPGSVSLTSSRESAA
jgi:hypothetical protein